MIIKDLEANGCEYVIEKQKDKKWSSIRINGEEITLFYPDNINKSCVLNDQNKIVLEFIK